MLPQRHRDIEVWTGLRDAATKFILCFLLGQAPLGTQTVVALSQHPGTHSDVRQ